MGGIDSDGYHRFRQFCAVGFILIRRQASILMIMLEAALRNHHHDLPCLREQTVDEVLKNIYAKLFPPDDDDEELLLLELASNHDDDDFLVLLNDDDDLSDLERIVIRRFLNLVDDCSRSFFFPFIMEKFHQWSMTYWT
jgi:hypothetical protein